MPFQFVAVPGQLPGGLPFCGQRICYHVQSASCNSRLRLPQVVDSVTPARLTFVEVR